jgi:hypothetical protein
MANPEHLAILKQGVETWNQWRNEYSGTRPLLRNAQLAGTAFDGIDLRGADLRGADLRKALFKRAILRGALFQGACLSGADLRRADLRGTEIISVDARRAILRRADLSGASLAGSDLTGSDFRWAVFRQTGLAQTQLSRAKLGWTVFANVDLREAQGLNEVIHEGPSAIDISCLHRANGQLPESFLQGCGVPEEFISYSRSMVGRTIEFYSCFISYSSNDQAFADILFTGLQDKGVRCWFAPHDIRGGKKIHEQIDEAIRVYDRLLLILSDSSMNSEWVKTEIANARQREIREKRQMLFPISLAPYEQIKEWKAFDADTGKDSAREIREYFIPDFSNWRNHDSYQKAFQRLLRDLKAEGPTT